MSDAIVVKDLTKTFMLPLDRSSTLKYRVTHLRSSSRRRVLNALKGVSFSVPDGQFIGIIGHNGSGKSTLLKILSRIYQPTSGSLEIKRRVSPFLELGVGFNPELNARENIFLNGSILGISRAELNAKVEEIIDFAGTEVRAQAGQKLKNFSSGMQVRLAFSVAIQANAGILLMDEVLAVGDAEFQQRCFDIFAQYKRDGRTVVLVTHSLDSVVNYCDRALLLDHGLLIDDDLPTKVVNHYRRIVGELQNTGRKPESKPDSTSEWGSGEVIVQSVQLMDENGVQQNVFDHRKPMTVVIKLLGQKPVDGLSCAVVIERADGVPIAGAGTRTARLPLSPLHPGELLELEWEVPSIPVLGGSYRLSVQAEDEHGGRVYHTKDGAAEFKVLQESHVGGVVDFGGKWRVGKRGIASHQSSPAAVDGAHS